MGATVKKEKLFEVVEYFIFRRTNRSKITLVNRKYVTVTNIHCRVFVSFL